MLEYSLCAFESWKIIIKEGELLAFMLPSVQIPNSLYLLLPLGLREGDFEAKKRAMENHGNLKSATTENQLKKIWYKKQSLK